MNGGPSGSGASASAHATGAPRTSGTFLTFAMECVRLGAARSGYNC